MVIVQPTLCFIFVDILLNFNFNSKIQSDRYTFDISYIFNTDYKKNTMHTEQACKKARLAIQDTLDIVGGKWKLVLLSILMDKKKRFRELSREIGISPRILSKELQELEINGLVSRTVCDTRPVTVEYAATPYSQTLKEVLNTMNKWGEQHRERIIKGNEN